MEKSYIDNLGLTVLDCNLFRISLDVLTDKKEVSAFPFLNYILSQFVINWFTAVSQEV